MILNDKDATTRIENVRYLRKKKDPPHAAVLNRPLRDLEERTNDVWDIMDPAKQFYVHEDSPASFTVVVEAGWSFNDEDFGTVTDPTYFAGDTVTVLAAAPNKIRMDLVYYDRATNTVAVLTGSEVQDSTGFASLWNDATPLRAVLPAGNSTYVPLAYLYVGALATHTFQDATSIVNAGHIRDVRMGSHVNWNMTTKDVATLKTDTPGGSAGTSQRVARSDHQHPANLPTSGVTGATAKTEKLYFNNTRAPGTESSYARVDHIHDLTIADTVGELSDDAASIAVGDAGSSAKLARSDHRHPLHIDVADPLPGTLNTALGAYRGSGEYYARHDHRHKVEGDVFMTVEAKEIKWYEWSVGYNRFIGQSTTKSTGAFSLRPLFAITLCCGKIYSASVGWIYWHDNPGLLNWGWTFEGNPPTSQYSISMQDSFQAGSSWHTSARESGSVANLGKPGQGFTTLIERELNCTYLGQSGATYSVDNGLWHGYLSTIAFGFYDV